MALEVRKRVRNVRYGIAGIPAAGVSLSGEEENMASKQWVASHDLVVTWSGKARAFHVDHARCACEEIGAAHSLFITTATFAPSMWPGLLLQTGGRWSAVPPLACA